MQNIKNILAVTTLIVSLTRIAHAVPVVYTNESLYLADLAALGYHSIHETFENDTVWAASRNSVSSPGSTLTVMSQGIIWTSNFPQNNIATGNVGGSAPDGMYAIYSLPHGMTTDSGLYCDSAEEPDIPIQCYQNDGLKVESEAGATLYGFGGRIDTANSGKITFLLDGVDVNGNDSDNIDNWQREGEFADNWTFVGVIDEGGFLSVEVRELRGKDFQQVFLFSDDFHLAVSFLKGDFNNNHQIDLIDAILGLQIIAGINITVTDVRHTDVNNDGRIGIADVVYILQNVLGSR